jgi:hypothetical protein
VAGRSRCLSVHPSETDTDALWTAGSALETFAACSVSSPSPSRMFILTCGRSSLGPDEVERDEGQDSERSRQAAAAVVTPFDSRRGSGFSGGDSWASSRSDRVDEGESPAPPRRVDPSLSRYDSMATRLKTASRSDFPSLWASVGRESTTTKRKDTLTTTSVDGEEIPMPDLHVGQYQFFCDPQTWSPMFASPGDFTVRAEAACDQSGGSTALRLAVVCCSIRPLKDAPTTETIKRKSFVKIVERSESELVKFSETMALKYLGHRLMDRLPKLTLSVLSSSQPQLEEYAEAVTAFLSYVLSITEIGYNRLLVLTEPVAENLIVREFFDLSLGFGDPGMVSTSSCGARLEHRAASDRTLLPSAWFDAMDRAGTHSKSFSLPGRDDSSPRRMKLMQSISSRRLSDSGFDFRASGFRSPHHHQSPNTPHEDNRSDGKCIRFIKPGRWSQEHSAPGAFTVEITGVTISDARAKYTICVIFELSGRREITTVDRRFSEFDSLVNRIEAKLRMLSLRNHFPTKTLFRYLSIGYLERRAAHLQRFLEKLLQMRFFGALDEEVTMVAEPNVRKFLNLPSVQWSITPWRVPRGPRANNRTTARINGGTDYTESSTSRAYPPPSYTSSPSSNASNESGAYEFEDVSSPRFANFSQARSGSM